MRLRQVTLLIFTLLSTSWDAQAQRQNPPPPSLAESAMDPSQVVQQDTKPLPQAPLLVPSAGNSLRAHIASAGPQGLHDKSLLYAFGNSGPVALVTEAKLSGAELPQAPQPQPGLQKAFESIASSADGASVSGVVLDSSGAVVVGAEVTLSSADGSQRRTLKSGADSNFTFTGVPPGSYVVKVQAKGFDIYISDRVVLAPQQSYDMPKIVMAIATANTEVTVRPTDVVAAEQLKAEERQRVFGVIPSYFTSYVYDAAPLTAKQKFSLTARDTFDPVSFIGVGIVAAIQQATNTFPGYGKGAGGYGKRYAAALGDSLTSDFLGHAVFPSLLHQDPRYFYQGSGSNKSRLIHAISFAVFTRSDSGHLTPNYSYVLGDLCSGALSNLYYPHADRGAGLVFTNAALSAAGRAGGSVFREFVSKHITTNVPGNGKP